MPIITTPELKAHLRLNDNSEDALLVGFIAAAEATFENLTGRVLTNNAQVGFPNGIPEPVKLAVKLLSAHYYANREAFAADRLDAVPFGFLSVCRQYSNKFVSPGAA